MVRPCVASGFAELAVSGLASMYPAFDWSICSGPSWISARVRSHYRTGLDWTIWVTSVRMRREDRASISSHPLADLGWKLLIGLRHRLLLISRSSFVRAKSRSFVPARRTSIASRAGAVKAGRRAWLAAGSGVVRLRLDRAEHGARIKRVGRRLHRRSSSARRRVLEPAPPRRCGQACWRARSRARCGATASWRLRSRI
jgi:hypothetical protein